jgi:LytS/YehU family sensor histidine kinase
MRKVNSGIVFNLIFWTLYFLYQWLGLAALSGQYGLYFINAVMALPLSLVVSLITVHFLVKKFYLKGRRIEFWVLQVVISIVLLLIRRHINYYIIYPHFAVEAQKVPLYSFGKLIVELVNLYLIVGVYSLFYFARSWYREQQRVQELLHEKTIAELESLKAQVQPHFIFNTLNNIYSVALKNSPETAGLISHLSSFLSYNLYESKRDKVLLTSEILYIKHYIELQKNRYGDKLDVSQNIYGEINDLFIAPLLILPLIENSFKHGIADSVSQGWIRMDVSRQKDYFSIKIENSIEEGAGQGNMGNDNGIGLQNVQKRLQLIYPGAHEFKTIREPHSYLAVLKIYIQG